MILLLTGPLSGNEVISGYEMASRVESLLKQVKAVNYPGLPSSPFHGLAQRLFGGSGGGVLSFEVKGGSSTADALLKACAQA